MILYLFLQFLLMPVAKISGIEDPILLYPRTPNFFAQVCIMVVYSYYAAHGR
jgi:CDP-diacylglycerol pyrophosphatase